MMRMQALAAIGAAFGVLDAGRYPIVRGPLTHAEEWKIQQRHAEHRMALAGAPWKFPRRPVRLRRREALNARRRIGQ